MARIAYPDPSDVAELMRRFPPPLRHTNIGRMVSHAPTLVAPSTTPTRRRCGRWSSTRSFAGSRSCALPSARPRSTCGRLR